MDDDDEPRYQSGLRALWDLWMLLLRLRDAADSQALLPTEPAAWEDTVPQARDAGGEGPGDAPGDAPGEPPGTGA